MLLVTGDDVACDEATDRLGVGLTAVVEAGIGPTAARMILPVRCRELIEEVLGGRSAT